jgi:primase-polymerase (primpol)-like protein
MSYPRLPSFRELVVPDDLAERDQWLLWRYEGRNGRATKVPYSVRGCRANSTEPRDWTSFDAALTTWRQHERRYAGVGFVFSRNDPFAGIDVDDSLDAEGNIKPWARGLVDRFADTYTEISPSGSGLKIWAGGSLPANLAAIKIGDGQIEIYDHARFFAVTGRVFRGSPLAIEDHSADLRLLYEQLAGGRKRCLLQPLESGRIPYGQQHSTLISLLGTLRARRVCDEAIEACLQAINARQCERPGPREHISRMVRSSRTWRQA